MRIKHVVCGLVVVALMGGGRSQARVEFFPWWAFDSVIEEVQDRGTLRVGLGLFEPWSACNADGELIGFEIDVATKVAEDMGVEVEFARTNWAYIISELIAKEFDVIISGMQILPQRNLRINFTAPYKTTGTFLVANIEKTADLVTLADFNSASVMIATRRGASSIPAIETVFLRPCSCSLTPTPRSSKPSSPVMPMQRQRLRRGGPRGLKPTRRLCICPSRSRLPRAWQVWPCAKGTSIP